MKTNKISFKFVIPLFLLISSLGFSQPCECEEKTMYLISINGQGQDGRPMFLSCLVDDLSKLSINEGNTNKAINSLFEFGAVYTLEPYLGYKQMLTVCDGAQERNDFLEKVKKISKRTKVYNIELDNSKILTLSIVKVSAVFWKLDFNENEINNVSHQFMINSSFYTKDYYYYFKNICAVNRLNRHETKIIRAIL